ncbi:MAG TPA: biotin--[acetyl-CoA-carboxylase] ligase [Bradyrhizobium sp.]|uniref:biotin--[acetyl-CoA-carboxylase] ligase n=1 Tax=Bradyrhizobium sp. TaxID=376 RepID=UPI002D7FDCB8|nr:biotin--[acetyl-CoA-carboxylase] ligase [Bradyrhizobium sp.]HET7884706.1 biotin--[acetyl-CoA-carboxylase] ligase [Bradyrhizobium sp.]
MLFTLGPRALSAGYRLASFDQIGSTNSEALARAQAGERGPMWFVTSEQTAGRGRRYRPWIAPRDNLAASVLETIDVAPATAATLGFAAGVALATALQAVASPAATKFSLKWPNDVLAGPAKLTGILLEAEAVQGRGLAVVVGMGTNVVAAPEGLPAPATSLRALGLDITAERLFTALSDSWAECRGVWDRGGGFGEIRRRWLALAAGLGQPVSVHTGQAIVSGIFQTIDDTGCMIITTPNGEQVPVSAGDVHFGLAGSARTG